MSRKIASTISELVCFKVLRPIFETHWPAISPKIYALRVMKLSQEK